MSSQSPSRKEAAWSRTPRTSRSGPFAHTSASTAPPGGPARCRTRSRRTTAAVGPRSAPRPCGRRGRVGSRRSPRRESADARPGRAVARRLGPVLRAGLELGLGLLGVRLHASSAGLASAAAGSPGAVAWVAGSAGAGAGVAGVGLRRLRCGLEAAAAAAAGTVSGRRLVTSPSVLSFPEPSADGAAGSSCCPGTGGAASGRAVGAESDVAAATGAGSGAVPPAGCDVVAAVTGASGRAARFWDGAARSVASGTRSVVAARGGSGVTGAPLRCCGKALRRRPEPGLSASCPRLGRGDDDGSAAVTATAVVATAFAALRCRRATP